MYLKWGPLHLITGTLLTHIHTTYFHEVQMANRVYIVLQ